MNLSAHGIFIFGVILLASGLVLLVNTYFSERTSHETPLSTQYGVLFSYVGLFIVLANKYTVDMAMVLFTVITIVIWLVSKALPSESIEADTISYAAGYTPVLLMLFLLRSFLLEPFQIPSSSMRPGLIDGDMILVSKFSYGLRTPITNQVFIPISNPARGDVAVFSYPKDPRKDYIKRIIGLPGDTIEYRNRSLTINGVAVKTESVGPAVYIDKNQLSARQTPLYQSALQRVETIDGKSFKTYIDAQKLPGTNLQQVDYYSTQGQCNYADDGSWFVCKVPKDNFFVMGDNRDQSEDSRYWGFVPNTNLVGKAFFIWMNTKEPSRIGRII